MTTTAVLGTLTLICATLATAMVAGLLFSFAHSVMPGLGTLDDRDLLTAFQRIDSAITNPWMMLSVTSTASLAALCCALFLIDRASG